MVEHPPKSHHPFPPFRRRSLLHSASITDDPVEAERTMHHFSSYRCCDHGPDPHHSIQISVDANNLSHPIDRTWPLYEYSIALIRSRRYGLIVMITTMWHRLHTPTFLRPHVWSRVVIVAITTVRPRTVVAVMYEYYCSSGVDVVGHCCHTIIQSFHNIVPSSSIGTPVLEPNEPELLTCTGHPHRMACPLLLY